MLMRQDVAFIGGVGIRLLASAPLFVTEEIIDLITVVPLQLFQ
jgi:hypothetical protein